jgi:hypothetical protein
VAISKRQSRRGSSQVDFRFYRVGDDVVIITKEWQIMEGRLEGDLCREFILDASRRKWEGRNWTGFRSSRRLESCEKGEKDFGREMGIAILRWYSRSTKESIRI